MISEVYLPVTTDASGDGSVTHNVDLMGRIIAVNWEDGDLVDGVDAVLSVVGNGRPDQTILTLTNANSDAWHYPVIQASSNAGGAVTGEYTQPLVSGFLKLVVSAGGATKSGSMRVYVER